ncbi:MAG TPA: zinc-ribbon domain-containing protein [Pirellulales bacterium]|nr:zinc-ribbon domain-containing protein [Pirellulales bacterium]
MPDILIKCGTCGAVLDEEDLFCPNCGAEAPKSEGESAPPAHVTTYNFTCKGCGASMSYDASAGTLRCPFCGSTELEKQPDAKEISPQGIVPFTIKQDQAIATMRQWLGSSLWRPGDLSEQAAIVKMTAVYVPYWVFEAQTHTFWTADTSKTPFGARASWCPITGQHEGTYRGLLVGASGALTPAETSALIPFDLASAVTPDQVDLTNSIYERFTVPRKYARPLANQGFEQLEANACRQYVPGSERNLKVNVRITDMTSQPMLLPVWIMAYRYQDRVFRFLVNGQTGRVTGQAPLSWRKIAVVAVIVVLAVIILLAIIGRKARGAPSPKPPHAVRIESRVTTDDRYVFGQRLSCQKSIERIPMVEWHRRQTACVPRLDRQDHEVISGNPALHEAIVISAEV